MHTNPSRPESIVDIATIVLRNKHKPLPTLDEILLEICEIFEADPEKIKAPGKPGEIVKVRYIFFYVASHILNKSISLKEIGHFMGGRHHTTVMFARDNMIGYLDKEDGYIWKEWEKYRSKSKIWRQYAVA